MPGAVGGGAQEAKISPHQARRFTDVVGGQRDCPFGQALRQLVRFQ